MLRASAFTIVLAGVACSSGFVLPALAADSVVAENTAETGPVAVADRARPAYDPAGIRVGGFTYFPSVAASVFYNDNVRASADEDGSFEYHLTPEMKVRSNWSRHSLEIYGGIDAIAYSNSDVDEFDRIEAIAGAKGRIDIQRDFAVLPSFEYKSELLQPGALDSIVAVDESVKRDVYDARLAISKSFNRLWFGTGVGVARVEFDEIDGVEYTGNEFLDYDVLSTSARLGYDISPLTSVFTELVYNNRAFDDETFDSDGYQVRGGVKFEASRLLHGEIYGGYLAQNFDSPELEDISTYTFGGDLKWFATPLWTATLSGRREAGESGYGDGSSLVISSLGVAVDYEVLRNLIVSSSLRYIDHSFQDEDREDETWQAGLSAKYLVNRNWNVSLDYRYTDFDTSAVDVESFSQNIYGATLRYQY
ncbi:outer membrane beta-barrel protein [Terrihabitans sp. B22-R8]|uniref:outer membrane beta-barrel protein n=1 Tax=Terrihabitans sp. B22-R8 TaxID=3425128 RepID=UPI00403D4A37